MIVLDTSAAVEMIRETKKGKCLRGLMYSNEQVVSISLFCGEVASTFWKYVRAGLMTTREATESARRAIALVDKFYVMQDFYLEALGEAVHLGHSPYDIFYLILAKKTGGVLFTLDKKLQDLCLKNGVDCVGDFDLTIDEDSVSPINVRVESSGAR